MQWNRQGEPHLQADLGQAGLQAVPDDQDRAPGQLKVAIGPQHRRSVRLLLGRPGFCCRKAEGEVSLPGALPGRAAQVYVAEVQVSHGEASIVPWTACCREQAQLAGLLATLPERPSDRLRIGTLQQAFGEGACAPPVAHSENAEAPPVLSPREGALARHAAPWQAVSQPVECLSTSASC